MLLLSLVFPLSLVALITGKAITIENICRGSKVVTSTRFIGADKNVKLEHITCGMLNTSEVAEKDILLQTCQSSEVCGAQCTTHCFTPAGGGPDPNECHIIADALRFDSQNVAPDFTVTNGANNIFSLTFASCTSFFLNQATTSLSYCRIDFASLIDFIAPNCQATQNAHGGLCVANDGRWFVQVEPMVATATISISTVHPTGTDPLSTITTGTVPPSTISTIGTVHPSSIATAPNEPVPSKTSQPT